MASKASRATWVSVVGHVGAAVEARLEFEVGKDTPHCSSRVWDDDKRSIFCRLLLDVTFLDGLSLVGFRSLSMNVSPSPLKIGESLCVGDSRCSSSLIFELHKWEPFLRSKDCRRIPWFTRESCIGLPDSMMYVNEKISQCLLMAHNLDSYNERILWHLLKEKQTRTLDMMAYI